MSHSEFIKTMDCLNVCRKFLQGKPATTEATRTMTGVLAELLELQIYRCGWQRLIRFKLLLLALKLTRG